MSNSYEFITDELKKQIESYKHENPKTEAGRIIACGDGVITIDGLKNVRNGELLYITGGNYALAMNLEENYIGAILLTDMEDLSEGMYVYCTGEIVSVPVGKELLGRVINPLGEVLDGGPSLRTKRHRNIEYPAPAILNRGRVNEPLYTGIRALDSMVPIGKGQRELIIGDRQTGKTAIAIDTIVNQKDKNVICVYVAIGQKASTVNSVIHSLKKHKALSYTVVVCSTASQTAPLQYIAPYTGTAIAEEFMYEGKDVLIVYDDLSKHAVAYRTISLLLQRPAGREAYPGDVFYIHSRLLERSAKLSESLGGGSITALPIIETLAGDISAYIPTNVISITDGQIYLETDLFNSGMRPAINVGLSVSRVGGSAQCKAMRRVSGAVRLELAHYREMAQFTQFGADLDEETKATLAKGARLTESLKQSQYSPVPMSEMVTELYIMTHDMITDIPVEEIRGFMTGFFEFLSVTDRSILQRIEKTKQFTEQDEKDINEILLAYRKLKHYE